MKKKIIIICVSVLLALAIIGTIVFVSNCSVTEKMKMQKALQILQHLFQMLIRKQTLSLRHRMTARAFRLICQIPLIIVLPQMFPHRRRVSLKLLLPITAVHRLLRMEESLMLIYPLR